MIVIKGDMIKLNKFVHLYRLKELKEFGYYKFVPWFKKARIIVDLPSSFRYWKSRYFFISGDDWRLPLVTFGVRFLGYFIGGGP